LLGVAKPTLKILANYGAGYEHIDTRAAAARGIMVTNTPDVLTDATAELAIMLMLMAARRAGEGERELRAGQWTGWRPTHLIGQGLTGKTLGLVGFGRIARATAKKARSAFDMEITYFTRNRADKTVEQELGATFYSSLEELAGVCDILSLHIPAGPGTRHLVDARLLSRLRPSAILVNTARGSLIDEAAVAEALRSGGIAGAGLDVFENEPAVSKDLVEAPGAVLLPHLGSATSETRVAMGMRVAENLDACFAGEEPRDCVI
jgi:lactate dehydrogenase-like 2-hydroxyacid dehydrogenase